MVSSTKSDKETEAMDAFRGDLESVLVVIKALSNVCATPAELAGIVQLASTNDGQLRILMEKVSQLR